MYKFRRVEYSKNYFNEETENLINAGVQQNESDDEIERELVCRRYSASLERYIVSSETR